MTHVQTFHHGYESFHDVSGALCAVQALMSSHHLLVTIVTCLNLDVVAYVD
jgi:hypothetical protein